MNKLTINNIDVFNALETKRNLIETVSNKYFKGIFLDIGCGRMPYKNIIDKNVDKYIGLDIENVTYQDKIIPEIFWDGKTIPLENESIDNCMLIEVLEHIPDTANALNESNRVLKKDGYVLLTVPFLWTLHDVPYDEYRFTPFALKRLLIDAGFEVVEMESFGNWDASLASMLALYVRRGPLGHIRKKVLSYLMLPVIKYLYKKDQKSDHKNFREGLMINGLWCVAKKL